MDYDPNLEPVNSFYQVEENKLTGEPGRLIRFESLIGAVAPEAAGASYRVIYESTSGIGDQIGKKIAVSGIVAFPAVPPRSGAWPVVSWAHGTVGSADKCAPSMDQFLDVAAKP